MAQIKRLITNYTSGKTLYGIARRIADKYRLDDANGSFASNPADPYVSLTEDSIIRGKYELEESRTVWNNGLYDWTIYDQLAGTPSPSADLVIGESIFNIRNDRIINLNDESDRLFSLIESQRSSHTGNTEIIYWNPENGNDNNSGYAYNDAKATFNFNGANGVHSLLSDNKHQIIIVIAENPSGTTIVNEYVEIDTAYTFLRGPGRNFLIQSTHNEVCAVMASAEGVELSGFITKTKLTGGQDGICIAADFCRVNSVWVDYSRGHGIAIKNASHNIIENFIIQDSAQSGGGHALYILGDTSPTVRNIIQAGKIFENSTGNNTDGIRIDGIYCLNNFIIGSDPGGIVIHENSGWGINEVNGADHTIVVGPRIHIDHNTLGKINLTGTYSNSENIQQWATDTNLTSLDTYVRNNVALETTLQTVSADLNDIEDFIRTNFTVASKVIVQPVQGNFDYTRIKNQQIEVKKGDSAIITYDIGTDITGYTIQFAAKERFEDTTYAIAVKDITADTITPSAGTGLLSLTSSETNIERGEYIGELKIINGSSISRPIEFKIKILDSIIS